MIGRIQLKYCVFIVSLCVIIITYSCLDDPLTSQNTVILQQIPGCQKNKLDKLSSGDSCFSYTFGKNLDLQFCVSGNCCPDSNRYVLSSKFSYDTLEIAVKDTADNLCKCLCVYFIKAQFENLMKDRYIIKCVQEDIIDNKVLYLQEVIRK